MAGTALGTNGPPTQSCGKDIGMIMMTHGQRRHVPLQITGLRTQGGRSEIWIARFRQARATHSGTQRMMRHVEFQPRGIQRKLRLPHQVQSQGVRYMGHLHSPRLLDGTRETNRYFETYSTGTTSSEPKVYFFGWFTATRTSCSGTDGVCPCRTCRATPEGASA